MKRQQTRRMHAAALCTPILKAQCQLKEAGLSPSLYAGAELGGGIGSTAGAQGAGGSGASIPGAAAGPVDLASINLMNAQADKAKADAQMTITEQEIAEIDKQLKEIDFAKAGVDANVLLGYVSDKDGKNKQSFAEVAQKSTSFNNFVKTLKEKGAQGIESEQAQRTLREIYKANRMLGRDIAVLSEQTISADFQKSIINFLNQKGFAEKNAESAIAELNAAIATNTLTESQKDAWNNVIEELKQANPTMANIAIILGMIVDRFAGQMVNKISIGPTNNIVEYNK